MDRTATELRDYAEHVRQLASGIGNREAVTRMIAYADELDDQANIMENNSVQNE